MELSGTGGESKLGFWPPGVLEENTDPLPDLSWGDFWVPLMLAYCMAGTHGAMAPGALRGGMYVWYVMALTTLNDLESVLLQAFI